LIARVASRLSLEWNEQRLRFAGKEFSSTDHSIALISPNPLNPARYVVINSGFTFAATGAGSNAQQTPKLPDYAVFNISGSETIVLAGFFDEEWRP